jgi:hypothetical protein
VKRKQLSPKELHAYVANACKHCGKLKERHLPVMTPDTTEWRCLDAYTLDSKRRHMFEAKK